MVRLAAEFQVAPLAIEGTELLDALVTSVFVLDQDLYVTYMNAAAQSLLGLGANQALGRRFSELTRGADTLLTLFERARSGGESVVQRELAWPAPGGVDRILDCAAIRRRNCCWKSKTSPNIVGSRVRTRCLHNSVAAA
jgi:nitrogen-specific signal transduction histidine kinase